MYLKNKKVLALGLGISGLSTVKALHKLDAQIVVSDSKTEEELKDFFDKIQDIYVEKYLSTTDVPLENIDLIVKSPGIPLSVPILHEARIRNIEIITDIELAYRISPTENIIAITGTNGKTTTTTLIGEVFKKANFNSYVAGNIGVGILWDMVNSKENDVFIIEASSFQLESTTYFKPKVSLITNLTPDHLDWHGSVDNYYNAKKKVFNNQDEEDYTVLNYDDKIIRKMKDEINSNIIWFSSSEILQKGVYVENNYIVIKDGEITTKILPIKDLRLLGKHNLENALGAVGVCWAMGIEVNIIAEVLKEFKGVEHRIEFVNTIKDISFYNDSKGTNSDSTIKAIEAIDAPIILIAGGYDKGSTFDELIKAFNEKVRELILLGATREKIKETAEKYNFDNIHLVENMKEAVELAYSHGNPNDNILLSPACASWGMYNNFEERGRDFKDIVNGLEGD
ncbi:UDP-N-acetylmuramoyl-L-alanine--D-glutamate ligase [Tissierella sp.]|uniref:UDP-N-acetylmuramoyl-L-alanine--D-glutamate ligase n=1 Tax=Tissierella sp. TaxID=41274 RepID=UPI00285A3D3E|nr:UDP-N-acetylmuramoyl-L-alanine--D-glutamate ligase [Tissierella sp.]MDR7857187.1 UDP-N-acetylmuramoyl-L-alanine--D-glutamate ligase [Tissierella sp.]